MCAVLFPLEERQPQSFNVEPKARIKELRRFRTTADRGGRTADFIRDNRHRSFRLWLNVKRTRRSTNSAHFVPNTIGVRPLFHRAVSRRVSDSTAGWAERSAPHQFAGRSRLAGRARFARPTLQASHRFPIARTRRDPAECLASFDPRDDDIKADESSFPSWITPLRSHR